MTAANAPASGAADGGGTAGRRLVALLAVVAFVLAGCGPDGPTTAASSVGDVLPEVVMPRLSDGASVSTDELLGQPLVVNFWASWCTYCIDEMPDLERVHQRFDGTVEFVGINREDSLDRARELAAETGVTYEHLIDDDGSFFRASKGRGMPTTLLVEPGGTIAYRHAGPLTADQLSELIDEHLAPTAG